MFISFYTHLFLPFFFLYIFLYISVFLNWALAFLTSIFSSLAADCDWMMKAKTKFVRRPCVMGWVGHPAKKYILLSTQQFKKKSYTGEKWRKYFDPLGLWESSHLWGMSWYSQSRAFDLLSVLQLILKSILWRITQLKSCLEVIFDCSLLWHI